MIAITPLLLPLLWIYEWIWILQYMVFIILGVSGGGEELWELSVEEGGK